MVDSNTDIYRRLLFSFLYKVSLLTLTVFLTPLFSIGQTQYFRHYQVEDGLSHNTVTCSLQDSKGFMWFGTKDGLNRFDGYTFKIFRKQKNDSTSLGCNFVQDLFEDKGILWVGTDEGLYRYNAETESFTIFDPSLRENIKDIVKDSSDNLWFISGYSLCRYNLKTKELLTLDPEKFFYATSVCTSPDGSVWVSTRDGIIKKYDKTNHFFTNFDVFENSPPSDTRWIEKITGTDHGSILIGTQSQGIKIFDVSSETYRDAKIHDESHSSLFVRDFVKNTDNEYWVATESGIYIYDIQKHSFKNLTKNYSNPYSLSDNAVYTVCKDKEGGIWAGTYFGGVNYFPKQYTPFEKFFPKVHENSISGNAVREICADKNGMIWIGTEDAGLNKFDPVTETFTNYMPNGKPDGISHSNIHGLLAVGDELWIGTFHHGLDVMNINTGKVIRHYSANDKPGGLRSNFIYSILQTSKGDILIGTSNGLYRYNPEKDNFTVIPAYSGAYEYTVMVTEDHQGVIWAGTYNNGVYFIDPETQKRGYYRNDPGNEKSLSNNFINSIFEDSKNNLWFATNSGICRLNRKDTTFERFDTEDGLPSSVIYGIEEDNGGLLWISSSKGLTRFDPSESTFKIYTTANGLLSDQFNYNSSFHSPDGEMYFGSVQGMVRFNPNEFVINDYTPPVHITGFQVNNEELKVGQQNSPLQKSITMTESITLDYAQSSFSIDFAALSYTAPEMTEYKFRMKGLNDDWTFLKTNRKVYFTELSPGEYTFEVKAANSSGIWNNNATTIMIEVLPPFWASRWAYVVYALLILIILFLAFTYYHNQTERKNREKIQALENEKEKEIYQAKIEFFTNVAHEIRTPLTLITGPMEKIQRMPIDDSSVKDTLSVMQKNANRLLDLTNQLLDFRKTEINEFTLTFVRSDIRALVEEVYSRFKPAIEEKKLHLSLNLPGHDVYAYVDQEALTKIISNLLSNAVKFAQSSLVISLSPFDLNQDDVFRLTISNDGEIIPEEMKEKIFDPFFRLNGHDQKGTGIGLPLARSLAELHKGKLNMDKSDRNMNAFILELPVRQEKEFKLYEENETVSESTTETHREAEEADQSRPSLLIAEDNKEMMAFISSELRHDYHLFEAYNGQEALEILDKEMIHIVISDIMMPVMDGMELCNRIKNNVEYSHIPVILLTAKNSLQSRIEGLESGADVYIEKPFSVEHLKVQVINLLTNKEKIRQYYVSNPLSHIKSMAHSKSDEVFLEKLHEVINKNISDSDLNVDYLAEELNMSKPTLYRKIKTVSNMTPNELINLARLKKAAELLATDDFKIYEVANMVGYNSQTSFGRNFHKQFGMTPSEFMVTKGEPLHDA